MSSQREEGEEWGVIDLVVALLSDVPGRNDKTTKSTKNVMRLAIASFLSFGYATGVMSGAGVLLEKSLGASALTEDVIVSAAIVCAGIAAPIGGALADKYGRRITILISGAVSFIGSLLSSFAPNVYFLIGARAVVGLGFGLSFNTVPLYAAECVPKEIRGLVVAMSDFCIVGGQLVSGIVNGSCAMLFGYGLAWRVALGFGIVPVIYMLYLIQKAPESPRFLAEDDPDAAKIILTSLRLGPIDDEFSDIQNEVGLENAAMNATATSGGIWQSKRVLRALQVGMGLQVLNQLTGINSIMFYGGQILTDAGFSTLLSIWLSAVLTLGQIFGVAIALKTIDKKGRRFTGLRSLALIIPALIFIGLAFVFHQTLLIFIFLIFYLASFGSGLSGISYVVNSEIYPLMIRGRAYSIGGALYWFFSVFVSLSFPVLSNSIGPQYPFWGFAFVAILGFLFYWFYLPETAGRSLEEINAFFESEPYPKNWHRRGFYGLDQENASSLDSPLVDAAADTPSSTVPGSSSLNSPRRATAEGQNHPSRNVV